jgi:hypothetical protein
MNKREIFMAEGTITAEPSSASRMQGLLTTFRQVGLPLLQALTETAANRQGEGAAAPESAPNTELFNALVDSTIALSQKLASKLGASEDQVDAWVRWALVGAASQTVAASFKSTGQPMPKEEVDRLAEIAIDLQSKFKTPLMPAGEPMPNTVAIFRAKMMETMVPVVGALAQYSFGRSEHALLAEVAEKLIKTADQVTRALAPSGSTPEQWRLLCWHVLRASGQIYTESHYAEADRLLYMNPDERTAYFAQHGNVPPMTQVWQAFNQRMAMLATLATYLDVPPSAQLEMQQGWT